MNIKNTLVGLALMVVLVSLTTVVLAQNSPLGAESAAVVKSTRANLSLYTPSTVYAEAGNVTELNITGVTATKSWQGYYGNVSGTVILEDSSGNRFYDWTSAEPQGEVYASVNSTITWTTVECAPFDDNTYLSNWNNIYGINDSDYDNLNVTYNLTDHQTFYTGYTTLTGCRTTYTHVSDAAQFTDFPAVVLSSDNNATLIFTSIIEDKADGTRQGATGFDGADHDFQVLVAENGNDGGSALTQYYFWIELE